MDVLHHTAKGGCNVLAARRICLHSLGECPSRCVLRGLGGGIALEGFELPQNSGGSQSPPPRASPAAAPLSFAIKGAKRRAVWSVARAVGRSVLRERGKGILT